MEIQAPKIEKLKCFRCKAVWYPRKEAFPKSCARCHSPYWHIKRKNPKVES